MRQMARARCKLRACFATAFSDWRRQKRIPLKMIARDLGISISTVAAWESGEYFPTGYNLELLVDYTGLPPCRLFCPLAENCAPPHCVLAPSPSSAPPVREPAAPAFAPAP